MNRKKLLYSGIAVLLAAVFIFGIFLFSHSTKDVVKEENDSNETNQVEKENDSPEKVSDNITTPVSEEQLITLTNLKGNVLVQKENGEEHQLTTETIIEQSDIIVTKESSSIELVIEGNGSAFIGENSEIQIAELSSSDAGVHITLNQKSGSIWHAGKHNDYYTVQLPEIKAVAEGTHFTTVIDPLTGLPTIFVSSGRVNASSPDSSSPGSGFPVLPTQQVTTYPDGGFGLGTIDVEQLVAATDPEIIKKMLKNKEAIDEENEQFRSNLDNEDDTEPFPVGLDSDDDIERLRENLDGLLGNILKAAADQGKMSEEEINQLIEETNQNIDDPDNRLSLDSPPLHSFPGIRGDSVDNVEKELAKRIQEERQRREQERQQRQQELENRQNNTQALIDKIQQERDRITQQNNELAEKKKREAEEKFRQQQEDEERLKQQQQRNAALLAKLRTESVKLKDQNLELENGPYIIQLNEIFSNVNTLSFNVTSTNNKVVSTKIDNQKLIITPHSAGNAIVTLSIKVLDVETSKTFKVTINQRPLPGPRGVSFTDTNHLKGMIGGEIVVENAPNETGITEYKLYWANAKREKVSEIAVIPKTSGRLSYAIPQGIHLPEGVTGILAYSINEYGESKSYAYTSFEDYKNIGINLQIPDQAIHMGETDELDMDLMQFIIDEYGQPIGSLEGFDIRFFSTNDDIGRVYDDGGYWIEGNQDGTVTITVTVVDLTQRYMPISTSFALRVLGWDPPKNIPTKLTFKDENPLPGKIGGTITLGAAENEDDITHYVLYLGNYIDDDRAEKMEEIAILPKDGKDIIFDIPGYLEFNDVVNSIIAVAANENGESENFIHVLIDDYVEMN